MKVPLLNKAFNVNSSTVEQVLGEDIRVEGESEYEHMVIKRGSREGALIFNQPVTITVDTVYCPYFFL